MVRGRPRTGSPSSPVTSPSDCAAWPDLSAPGKCAAEAVAAGEGAERSTGPRGRQGEPKRAGQVVATARVAPSTPFRVRAADPSQRTPAALRDGRDAPRIVRPPCAAARRGPPSTPLAAAGGCPVPEEAMREAHVPAQQPPAQAEARLPFPDADAGGSRDPAVPPGAGPSAPVRLIWRVRDRATFAALRRARPWRYGPVTVRAVAVDHPADPPRVAYAVGRGAGGAVQRNRLRRRLRAAVREERGALSAGLAYLVGAGAPAHRVAASALRRDVAAGLRSASKAVR